MNPRSNKYSQIPLDNLAENIFHGPYSAAPKELVEHYVNSREARLVPSSTSDEQLAADTESEWQYDQHAEAVIRASEKDMITPEHVLFMLDTVLRP